MDLEAGAIALSLGLLGAALGVMSVRGFARFTETRSVRELMWGTGLACGTAAMLLEFAAYIGFVNGLLLQGYVFLSAAIVGVLSLGSAGSFKRKWFERAYFAYMAPAFALIGYASFTTPLSTSMVTQGIITGNPPLLLIVLSSLVTVPATIVLLTAAVLSLRRSFRWHGVLMLAGATVLGAGGALYIASFPVMLYYAEFIGIVMLFVGLVNLSRLRLPASTATPQSRPS